MRWRRQRPQAGEELPPIVPASPSAEASEEDVPRYRKSARDKIMDYLARRGHSELELRQKLSRTYEPDEVDDAITFARENNWMTEEGELAERVAEELGRKKKGHRYINQFLKSRGLPSVKKDLEAEVRKGLAIATSKLAKEGPFDYEERKKIHRLLANRGFDEETIRRVLKHEGSPDAIDEQLD